MRAFVRRTVRSVRIVVRDGRIPRPIRWGGAVGLLPVPGPFDEIVLLLVAAALWLFYRDQLTEAWERAADADVVRLLTVADLQETGVDRDMSVSARLEAVLADGRRIVLLDDRGWTSSLRGAGADTMDVWATTSEGEIAETARTVVGPDEAYGGRSQTDMETGHWNTLAGTLHEHGVAADADRLRRLPHDVVLTDRLRARLG